MKKYFFIWLFITLILTSIPQNRLISTTTLLSSLSHFFFYATLSILFLASFRVKKCKMLIFLILIAAFDELHQFLIPGRYPSFIDFFIDLAGGIFVCLSV